MGPNLFLSRTQLASIVSAFHYLRTLRLRNVVLEDLAPLEEGKRIQTLMLEHCTRTRIHSDGCSGVSEEEAPRPLRARAELPSLPLLSSLVLYDRRRLSPAALLVRMPALSPERLVQNLLQPLPTSWAWNAKR